jgi:hypothetical protein
MAAGDGLVSMKPTSISWSGTTAGINADGGVDFTAVTSLSLNGVFTSDYDNYLIVIRASTSATPMRVYWRLRTSGTDATGSNYTNQQLEAYSTTVAASRQTNQDKASHVIYAGGTSWQNYHHHFYGPALAQPTASRNISHFDSGISIADTAWTHSLSTAYDGVTMLTGTADTFTGNVHVFGYEE